MQNQVGLLTDQNIYCPPQTWKMMTCGPQTRPQGERRRRKRRRGKQQLQQWRDASTPESATDRENELNPEEAKSKSHQLQRSRSRASRYREERRRRRRNRKNMKRGGMGRRDQRKWRDAGLIEPSALELVTSGSRDQASLLGDNPLNLSTTSGTSRIADTTRSNDTSSAVLPSPQLMNYESRIPEPPRPTSRYHIVPNIVSSRVAVEEHPGEVEREFSRNLEREYSRLAEKAAHGDGEDYESYGAEGEEEENVQEVLPSFDEKYGSQTTRQPEDKTHFDPERMLGYSRTDEDLPILDMENEVLQRTLNDYNAYMSSSLGRAALVGKDKIEQSSEHRRWGSNNAIPDVPLSASRESEDDEPKGDLSCINGTFVPAPFVHHTVIKYVKSSRPGHEYLEADYECEPGYELSRRNSSRLVCKSRRWLGKPPTCQRSRDHDRASSCAELGCEQLCKLNAGRAECLCHEGFKAEGRFCIDIDECGVNGGRGPCEDVCANLAGGYECSCTGTGRSLNSDRHTCRNSPTTEKSQAEAEITESGPCSYGNAGCSHTCLASMGRVFCLCPEGFVLQDDWKTCQDVDECAVPELQSEPCRFGCINTPGSYRCVPGPVASKSKQQQQQTMSGRTLNRSGECPPGYRSTSSNTCVDIDECSTNNGGCKEICENTEGSYFCACEGDERVLSSDRVSCVVAEERFQSMDREAALRMRFREASDIFCSPLNLAGRGYLLCADSQTTSVAPDSALVSASTTSPESDIVAATRRKNDDNDDEDEDEDEDETSGLVRSQVEPSPIRPGTKCQLQCPHGYELRGEYELTCRADGTWDGPKHGECLRYSKPRLDCPKDVVAELPPGRDEAFVTYEQPSTDLDWFRYVRSKPSWGTRLEANLKQGLHEITFYARHPVSKKQATCTLKITVQEGQAPKVTGCPSDIEITGKNGSAIAWDEPVFTDNIKVTRVTSNESPGQSFSLGGHKVEYEAGDEAGWTTKCIFTVVLRPITDTSPAYD
ncbi:hypothetical protein QAD02_004123 [Eretmocerus hayati]|uniref:Uncharacterized protein n=1 Tax=Eretmocerus hayati TaxID=131215 RepID=A0ACC2NNV8_9HYME|nr:hypothetical protein QAD02_004123 [Eretmocerus hayati]